MTTRDQLLAALVALLWGLNFVVIDLGMAGVPPLLFLAIRFVAVCFPAVLLVPRPQVGWRTLALVGGLMSLGQFGFLYLSIAAGMPAGLAALVLQAQVVFTVLAATVLLGERPTALQSGGIAVGAVGLLVVAAGREADVPLLALLLCVAAALSWGLGNVAARAAGVGGGLSLTVWSGLVVPVPALALSLVVDGPSGVLAGLAAFGWEAALSTAYTAGLASLVGYGIFNTLLARNPASSVVPFVLLVPPVAMVSAWLVLAEVPGPLELAGGALLLLGVLVATRRPRAGRGARAAQPSLPGRGARAARPEPRDPSTCAPTPAP